LQRQQHRNNQQRTAGGRHRGEHARSLAQIMQRTRRAQNFGRGGSQQQRTQQQSHLVAAERHAGRHDREADRHYVRAPFERELQQQ